ncbi:ABC transporter substrate-binding protein [Nesterenkonia ebinurensis]|uniref:ABC transporter substrate-binding protein n=1 Tax=Nesterenkonia ebinurensis TaxID=2608252 RepID=UPI00123E0312|nr:ABC transporter substrate-binding protein [Nesterenkonia ebinurensis]
MRRQTIASGAAAALLLASACGGNGDTEEASNDEDLADGGELTEVTVGVMPIVDTAAIWLGVEEGIFEEHGLDVTLEVAQGGAAIVPAVVSGDYDFGFSNTVSLYIAVDQGLPLTMLTPAAATTGDTSSDIGAVLAPEGSDISSPADLPGNTVAVNTLNNIGDVTISDMVAQDGGDPSDITFVEMGFPDMPAAVASEQVDAAWILEPYKSIAENQGAEVVGYNFAEADPDLLIAAFFTTQQNVEQEPEVVEAFADAMTESLDYAESNPDAAREILSTYTEIDDEIQEQMIMPRFPSEFNTEAVQRLADLSFEQGLIDEELDVADLIN